jgi:hypothetical protein
MLSWSIGVKFMMTKYVFITQIMLTISHGISVFLNCLQKNRHLSSLDILCTNGENCLFIFIFRDMLCVILEYIICIRGGKKRTMGIPDFQKLDNWDTNKTHAFFGTSIEGNNCLLFI